MTEVKIYECDNCGFRDTTDMAEHTWGCLSCDKDFCSSCAVAHALDESFGHRNWSELLE